MSENRSLSILEVLVHLTDTLPDKYVLGSAQIPDDLLCETVNECDLPPNWSTLTVRNQNATREIGDLWVQSQRSAILLVPSVVVGEKNLILNPEHPDMDRIQFLEPVPFTFDARLLSGKLLRFKIQLRGSRRYFTLVPVPSNTARRDSKA